LLESRDLIRCGRGRIHIKDRAALEQSACECYFSIRQRTDKLFLPTEARDLARPAVNKVAAL
jgi:hypothetical protein